MFGSYGASQTIQCTMAKLNFEIRQKKTGGTLGRNEITKSFKFLFQDEAELNVE